MNLFSFRQKNVKLPNASDVEEYCLEVIEQMLETAKEERTERQPELPLIRIRLECTDPTLALSANHFAQKTVGRVANPKDVLLFKIRREPNAKHRVEMDRQLMDNLTEEAKFAQVCGIDDVIREYFEQVDPSSQLDFLFEKLLTESVRDCVEKDVCRMQAVIDWHLTKVQEKFLAPGIPLSRILQDEQLVREMAQDFKEKLKNDEESNLENVRKVLKLDEKTSGSIAKPPKSRKTIDSDEEVLQLDSSDAEMATEEEEVKTKSGRGRGATRSRGRARGRGRGKAETGKSISDYMCFKR
jgi:hypothetical protein